jgi:hypothetical protein
MEAPTPRRRFARAARFGGKHATKRIFFVIELTVSFAPGFEA